MAVEPIAPIELRALQRRLTWSDGAGDYRPREKTVSGQKVIAIVDDDDGVRRSTSALLKGAGHHVVGYASGDIFLAAATGADADCILLDICMPGTSGIDVLRKLRSRGAVPPVVVLTAHGAVSEAVEAMKLGAVDFLEKPYPPRELLQSIDGAIAKGAAPPTPGADAAASVRVRALSERQLQVLKGMLRGEPNKLIAFHLGLSIRTVEAYRAQLLDKLGVKGSADAIRVGLAAGLSAT